MSRIGHGFRCTSLSFAVLRENRQMIVFPAVATVAQAVIAAAYVYGALGGPGRFVSSRHFSLLELVPLVVVCTLLSTLSTAVVVSAADLQLRGEPADIPSALRRLRGRWAALFAWALLTSTIGIVLHLLQERLGWLGRLFTTLADVAWSVASLLVVPVLVVEGEGPVAGVRRSAHLVRSRWVEAASGETGMGLAVFLLALPLFLVAALGFAGGRSLGVATMILAVVAYLAVSASLSGVLTLVLYRFAANGEAIAGFGMGDLEAMLRAKRDKDRFSGGGGGRAHWAGSDNRRMLGADNPRIL